ncbi:hypothetical protein RR46_05189 [Papilio xuthus]|nr:hypothetical protein RR46_05189 [Papilio xuthus]
MQSVEECGRRRRGRGLGTGVGEAGAGSGRRRRGREGALPSTGAVCNARIDYGGALPSLIIRPPRIAV